MENCQCFVATSKTFKTIGGSIDIVSNCCETINEEFTSISKNGHIMSSSRCVIIFCSGINESNVAMKLFNPTNVFEASKFYFLINKLIGFLFFTVVKVPSGGFACKTSKLDMTVFVSSLVFFTWAFADSFFLEPLVISPSVIVTIGIWINLKLTMSQSIVFVLLNFHHRKRFYQVFKNFWWIDRKVGN
jgi:hypothetical protein